MSAPTLTLNSPSRQQSLTLLDYQISGREQSRESAAPDYHQFLESVWLHSSEAMRITDSKGIIVAVNDAYCRLVGMCREELVGKPFTVVFDQSVDPASLISKYCRRFEERNVEPLMKRQISLRSGATVWVETSNSHIKAGDGSIVLLSIVRDITERRQLEETLKESERQYHDFFNNAVQGVFQSSSDGRLLSANHALLTMLGFDSFEELAALNLADLYVDPLQREALSMMLSEKKVCSNLELALKRKDGVVITVVEHSRVVRDAGGKETIFEGMLEDITARKVIEESNRRAELTVQNERNLLRTLIDNVPDLIYFKDSAGRYILNNRAHLRSIGAESQEDVLGKSSYDFHPAELAKKYQDDEMSIVHSAQPLVENEELSLHKDTGNHHWHLTSKFPLMRNDGTVSGVIGISRDITKRKELEERLRENLSALQTSREQLAQLNAQKDRLMSVLSHDLRSPFTSILGFCEILLTESESLSDAEHTEFVTYIQRSAEQQLVLLNKLLQWSRLETGRITLELNEVDLATIASNSVNAHLGTAKKKEITVRSTLPPNMMVSADEAMLTQVFNNLLSNAMKFTPAGGVITIDAGASQHDAWVVAVKDTGAGIPKEDLKKLFKIEEKYTRRGLQGEEGTGLGLSVVAEVVKKHSGSITVESEVGRGTTFTIRLPRLVQESDQTLLVVDDDQGIRVLHARYLKRMFPQAEVVQASDGREALQLAKRYHPRLIITDYSMPEMNGFELLNLLKQDPTTQDIPVIIVTGKESDDGRESLLVSGASAVLTKPVSSKELQESIDSVLAEKV